MREIFFRGKGTHGFARGKWIYGNYAKDFWGEQHKGFGIHPKEGGYSEVDPETVGQYTGLTDKNGKKIFEGDIVILTLQDCVEVGVIVWCDTDYRYKFVSPDGTAYGFDNTCEFEVIGNIHDNPELLKRGVNNEKIF